MASESRVLNPYQEDMIKEACKQLLKEGKWTAGAKFKSAVKRTVLRQTADREDLIFWKSGILAVALVEELKRGCGDDYDYAIEKTLTAYFDRWIHKRGRIVYIDDLLAGEALFNFTEFIKNREDTTDTRQMALSTHIKTIQRIAQYNQGMSIMASYAANYKTDDSGSMPYRLSHDDGRIICDLIGLACPFMYKYGVATGNDDLCKKAVTQILNFVENGTDSDTGLPYHAYTGEVCLGRIGWGRSCGWILRGMTGCMTSDYGQGALKAVFVKLLDAVLKYQKANGAFTDLLTDKNAQADSSATGLICMAIEEALGIGILTGEKETVYKEALDSGKKFIKSQIKDGKVYSCAGECSDLNDYSRVFDAFAWSLGPALLLLG